MLALPVFLDVLSVMSFIADQVGDYAVLASRK
jgi:hypothetical protein